MTSQVMVVGVPQKSPLLYKHRAFLFQRVKFSGSHTPGTLESLAFVVGFVFVQQSLNFSSIKKQPLAS